MRPAQSGCHSADPLLLTRFCCILASVRAEDGRVFYWELVEAQQVRALHGWSSATHCRAALQALMLQAAGGKPEAALPCTAAAWTASPA